MWSCLCCYIYCLFISSSWRKNELELVWTFWIILFLRFKSLYFWFFFSIKTSLLLSSIGKLFSFHYLSWKRVFLLFQWFCPLSNVVLMIISLIALVGMSLHSVYLTIQWSLCDLSTDSLIFDRSFFNFTWRCSVSSCTTSDIWGFDCTETAIWYHDIVGDYFCSNFHYRRSYLRWLPYFVLHFL